MGVYREGRFYRIRFTYKGKTYIKSSRSTRKADAVALEAKMRSDLVNKYDLGKLDTTNLYDALDQYERSKEKKGAHLTFIQFAKIFRESFPNIELHPITNKDLYRWIEEEKARGISESTIRLRTFQFNKLVKWCKAIGYQTPEYEWPKFEIKRKPIRFLTEEEEQRIIDELNPNNVKDCNHKANRQQALDLFITMLDLGCRVGEAVKLKWEDVDLENRLVHVDRHKVGNEDYIPMTSRLFLALARMDKNKTSEYVFPGRKPNTHRTVSNNKALMAAFERAGVHTGTHTCRKTLATRLLRNGVDIVTVSRWLGHSKLQTTMSSYAAFIAEDKYREAVQTLESERPKLKVVR